MSRRAVRKRGRWLDVVPSAAATSLLATLSLASLCLCGDDGIRVQSFLDGCELAGQQHAEFAVHVEGSDDTCLGPCVDVRILAAGAPGDERPPVPAPGLAAAPDGLVSDSTQLSLLEARPRAGRLTAEHLDYTILRR